MPRLSFALLLLAFPYFVFGQNSGQAELIDTFGRITCEDLESHANALASRVKNNERSTAVVVVYPTGRDRGLFISRFRIILKYFEYFEVENRIEFRIAHADNLGQTEFWIIPDAGIEPTIAGEKWTLPQPNLSKAFLYDVEDYIGICSTFVPKKFAELLLANPGSKANIVVKVAHGERWAKGFAGETIKTLVEKFKVDRKRIRAFYVRGNRKETLTYAEYWFVPAKKAKSDSK